MSEGFEDSIVALRGQRRRKIGEDRIKAGGEPKEFKKAPQSALIDPTINIPRPAPATFPSSPKWTDPDEFEACVNAYFEYCDTNLITKQMGHSKGITIMRIPIPYSMAGLARALGISRDALNRYKHQDNGLAEANPEIAQKIADIIFRARDRIHENNISMGLLGIHDSKISELNLINNFGYTRKTEIELPAGGEINVVFSTDRTQKRIDDLEQKNLELMKRLNSIEFKPSDKEEG